MCKPLADVVVVHPAPRFTTAENRQKWEEACRWALLAYCNHGAKSKDTFADKVQLEGLSTEEQHELIEKFIFTEAHDRQEQRLTQCTPHIRKRYLRGLARLVRMEKRIHTHDTVTASMREIKFVFTDEETWQQTLYDDMTPEDQNTANLAWAESNEAEEEEEITEETPGVKLCPNIDTNAIRNQMKYYMTSKLKWSNRALHDASVLAGLNTPSRPSLLNYFNTLRLQFSDPKAGFFYHRPIRAIRSLEYLPC